MLWSTDWLYPSHHQRPRRQIGALVLASGNVAYLRGDGARIEIVSADGKVGPSSADIAPNPAAWSPDGSHVVYSRTA